MKKTCNLKRFIAVVLITILFSTVFFSCDFIIKYAHHDCCGEHCPICLQIETAVHTISDFKLIPVSMFIITVLCIFAQERTQLTTFHCVKNTLVSLKVELLD